MEYVGELPPLSDEQYSELERQLSNIDSRLDERLLRHRYLYVLDENTYDETGGRVLEYLDDESVRQLKYISDEKNWDEYGDILLDAAEEYMSNINNRWPTILLDLLLPSKIPNEYNAETRKRVLNMMSMLYWINKTTDKNTLSPYELLFTIDPLTDVRGRAQLYLTKYMNVYPMIAKTDVYTSKISNDVFISEYLTGIVMNNLRHNIPNFIYTYGMSSGIGIGENNDHIGFGRRTSYSDFYYFSRDVEYANKVILYLEYIGNSVTLNRLFSLKSSSNSDVVIPVIIQILCALLYAYQKVGFIHRDLNYGNILLVTLPEVMAIPVMVPVSYQWTDDPNRPIVQFEKRWMLTDIMPVIIDYGQSTVRSESLHSDIYDFNRLINLDSIHMSYDSNAGFTNDIVMLILRLSELMYTSDTPNLQLEDDFMRMLYTIYTGDTLSDDDLKDYRYAPYYAILNSTTYELGDTEGYYRQVHPLGIYDPYSAIVNFVDKYIDEYTTTDYPIGYTNVLSKGPDNKIAFRAISTPMEYYWYTRYPDILGPPLRVDLDSIASDTHFTDTVLKRAMHEDNYTDINMDNPNRVYGIYRKGNLDRRQYTRDVVNFIHRYMKYFDPDVRVNVYPFEYDDPDQILSDMTKVFNKLDELERQRDEEMRKEYEREWGIRPTQ